MKLIAARHERIVGPSFESTPPSATAMVVALVLAENDIRHHRCMKHAPSVHARNDARADDARRELSEAEAIVVGNLQTIAGARDVGAACVRDQHAGCLHFGGIDFEAPAARVPELRHAPPRRGQH